MARLLDESLVEELRRVSASALEHASNITRMPVDRLLSVTTAWGRRNPQVRKLEQLARVPIHQLMSDFVDVKPKPVDASLFLLSQACGDRTHAHQDLAYKWNQPTERRYGITSWVALDSCGPAQGGLSLLPGSQRPPLEVRQDFLSSTHVERADSTCWRRNASTPPLRPGDAAIFDSCIWHAAESYLQTGFRRALAIRWSTRAGTELNRPIPVPTPQPSEFGMDTSGTLLCLAIRQAFPAPGLKLETDDTLVFIEWLRSQSDTEDFVLTKEAWHVVEDLADALTLLRDHDARPATRVWRGVRDTLLPELHGIASRYELRGMS